MRLVTYRHPRTGGTPRAGVLDGDTIIDIGRLTNDLIPPSMAGILAGWSAIAAPLYEAAQQFVIAHRDTATVPTEIAVPAWEASLFSPIPQPDAYYEFDAFDEQTVGPESSLTFRHGVALVGPGADIDMPGETLSFGFGAQIAAVIGLSGRDILRNEALAHIAGFSLVNVWAIRDQLPNGNHPLPISIGPWLVTPETFGERLTDGRLHLDLSIRIHGDTIATTPTGSMTWSFADLIATASRAAELRPGDVVASGPVPNGSLGDLDRTIHPWLEHDDEVEIEATDLGRLWNRVS